MTMQPTVQTNGSPCRRIIHPKSQVKNDFFSLYKDV